MKQSTEDLKRKRSMSKLSENAIPNWVFHVLFALLGIIMIVIGTGSPGETVEDSWISPGVKTMILSFGQALLVGMCISFILDLPFMRHYYRNRIIDVLISDEYLGQQSREKLQKLRSDITEKLYINDTEHHDRSLLVLDEKITKFLSEPYYEHYRADIVVAKRPDGNLLKRTVIRYRLTNPKGSEVTEVMKGRIWLHKIDGMEPEQIYSVKKLKIKKDDGKDEDFTTCVKVDIQPPVEHDTNYDYQFMMKDLNKAGKEDDFISVTYTKSLDVELIDERIMPEYDNIFVKRIDDNPVKSFLISYKTTGMDCRLEGTCLGTLCKVTSGDIRVVKQDSSIAIECFSWLLPGNGIMIATLPNNIRKDLKNTAILAAEAAKN